MRLISRLLMTLPALLMSGSLLAQTTSTLTGTTTTEGTTLPGVTVTISSPNLQGDRTAVTGEGGGYSFSGIPPGPYTIKFDLAGMQTVTKTSIVPLGQTARADADLRLSAVAEAITVTASAPAALETTQVASTFTYEEIDELPIGRTPLAAASLAPGVNPNATFSGGQLSISGSPGYDNLVMVNGVVVTENVRSQALDLFIEDAIQETTVLTGAISAEYGRFTGGVVNSITKSGGNDFSGSLRDSFTNPKWTKTEKNPAFSVLAGAVTPRFQPDPIDILNEVYEGTLGGRIIRDRLWFFGAGRYFETTGEAFTGTTLIKYPTGAEETRLEGKLTATITPRHTVNGSYLEIDRTSINGSFGTILDLASLSNRADPQTLLSGHYSGILTPNLLIEGQYSERKYNIAVGSGSQFTDLVRGTLLLDRSRGNARFNSPTFCGVCDTESRDNDAWLAKATYFLSTGSFGNHNIIAGIEDFSEHRYANNFQSGSNFRIFVEKVNIDGSGNFFPVATAAPASAATPARTFIRHTPISVGANENDFATQSLFVNDSWELNRFFSFNLGVRYDQNNTVNGLGETVSDDKAVSPRLTAIWDPLGNGRHRLSASYNQYVSRIVEGPGTATDSAGQPATVDYDYRGPAINATANTVTTQQYIQMVFDWFNSQGGTSKVSLLRPGGARFVPGFGAVLNQSLASPVTDEIQLGYGVQVGRNAYAKIDLISRDWKNFYASRVDQSTPMTTTPLGIRSDAESIENSNEIERTYKAVQLQTRWNPTLLRTNFNMGLTYTWSELRGNDEGESANSGTGTNAPLSSYYPEYLGYANRLPVGYLGGLDQTHRARAWVGLDLPLPPVIGTVNLSVLHNFDSGAAYSLAGTIGTTGYTGAPTVAKYVNAPTTGTYFFSERGAFRFADINRTDVSVNYNLPILGLNFFVQGDMLNVFGNDEMVAFNTQIFAAGNAGVFTGLERFNPFTDTPKECNPVATSCAGQGAHFVKGQLFGLPTGFGSYQLPQLYRFSAGFRF
ncbi:MAG TPA: TonB-dependent receptor [Thermoanaerobaculia bacterium]|nr:TonB-dependent receptor [Thermoanaerobaculia bacterium]